MGKSKITTLQAITASFSERGKEPALHEFRKGDDKVWSFTELDDFSKRLAAGLVQAGAEPRSHAILFASNRAEWVIACLALLRAGIVPVPIDAQMDPEGFAEAVEQCEASWIFTSTNLAEHARVSKKRELIFLDAGDDDERGWKRFLSDQRFDPSPADPEDRAVLFYTSGTSGKPKSVPLTHRNVASNLSALLELNLIQDTDRVLLPLPLHHVYPFTVGMLAPLARGVPLVLPYLLTGPQLQRALHEGRATAIIGVPRLYDAFYAAIENKIRQKSRILLGMFRGALKLAVIARRLRWPLGRFLFASVRQQIAPDLRILASGGAALDTDLAVKLEALGWQLVTGYGLTETAPILTFDPPGQRRIGAAGKPLPGVDIKIEKPEKNVPHGEILAKGPNVFSGYLTKRKEEHEVFNNEGYFRTGDLGFMDSEGYLHLVGRASSMIVLSQGENIWPEKIEEALEQSQWIREAGVFVKDDRLAAVLVIERADGQESGNGQREDLIRSDIDKRLQTLPSHHRIAEYVMASDPLPRTHLGKIQRHQLPEVFEQANSNDDQSEEKKPPLKISELSPEDQTLLQDPAARNIWEWLVQRFTDVQIAPGLNLRRDLGIDSMDWLNLTLEVRERAGVELDENAIGRIQTVRDLLREVTEGPAADHEKEAAQWLERPHELLSERQRKWLQPPGLLGKLIGGAILGLNRLFMRWIYRLEIHGNQNLPKNRPFIVAPNHTSFLDPLAVGAALPRAQLRHTYWGGWTGIMFKTPIMRLVSGALRVVPVDPKQGPLSALAFGIAALAEENNLVWFPEGGRSKDGTLQRFRPGIGILLATHSIPAVPVYIHGAFQALPYGHLWPRFGKIVVTFGEPFHPEVSASDQLQEEKHQEIADALRERVEALEREFKS